MAVFYIVSAAGPSYAEFSAQQGYIRKILGVMAFLKLFLQKLVELPAATSRPTEELEFIEQMRIIEHALRPRRAD